MDIIKEAEQFRKRQLKGTQPTSAKKPMGLRQFYAGMVMAGRIAAGARTDSAEFFRDNLRIADEQIAADDR